MRLLRVRFTVRGILVLIALLALPMAYVNARLRARYEPYRREAASHAFIEDRWRDELRALSPGGQKRELLLKRGYLAKSIDERCEWVRGMVRYHAMLKSKYQRAV